jgi:hypothetical protein
MRRALAIAGTLTALLGVAGCTAPPSVSVDGAPTPSSVHLRVPGFEHPEVDHGPGAFRVQSGAASVDLAPTAYCYRGGCRDGAAPTPPAVAASTELRVWVPVPQFTKLIVRMIAVDGGHADAAVATSLGYGWWRIEPGGPAGDHLVELFASGAGVGDMSVAFLWHTTADD